VRVCTIFASPKRGGNDATKIRIRAERRLGELLRS
jgi:hypothetical protein